MILYTSVYSNTRQLKYQMLDYIKIRNKIDFFLDVVDFVQYFVYTSVYNNTRQLKSQMIEYMFTVTSDSWNLKCLSI